MSQEDIEKHEEFAETLVNESVTKIAKSLGIEVSEKLTIAVRPVILNVILESSLYSAGLLTGLDFRGDL